MNNTIVKPEMKKFVIGFAFTDKYEKVMLIRKNRPEYFKGLWNGVGGHIEEGEMPVEAMSREFTEETGICNVRTEWRYFLKINFRNPNFLGEMHCFSYRPNLTTDEVMEAINNSPTDESLGLFNVQSLPLNIIRNSKWLIPMALDRDILQSEIFSQ